MNRCLHFRREWLQLTTVFALAAMTLPACTEVRTVVRDSDRPFKTERRQVNDPVPPTIHINATLGDARLTVGVSKDVSCVEFIDVTVDRTEITEKRDADNKEIPDSKISNAYWIGGAGWLATAVGTVLLALLPKFSDVGEKDATTGDVSMPTRTKVAIGAGAAVGLGIITGIWGVADGARMTGSSRHIGLVPLPKAQVKTTCNLPVKGESVTVVFPDGRRETRTLDAGWTVTFDLPDDRTLLSWKSNPRLKVEFGARSESVSFSSLPRFQQALRKEEGDRQRFLEAQKAAERTMDTIRKGDAMWVPLSPRSTRDFASVAVQAQGGGLLYALTPRGDLMRSVNGGLDWSAVHGAALEGKKIERISLDARDAGLLLAAAGDGAVFLSRDRGDSWVSLQPVPRDAPAGGAPAEEAGIFHALLVVRDPVTSTAASAGGGSAQILLAATSDGLFRAQAGGGDAWVKVDGLPAGGVKSVAASSEGARLLVIMQDGKIELSQDAGRSWNAVQDPGVLSVGVPRLAYVHPTDPNLLLVVAGDASILRSRDGGEHFEPASSALQAGLLITDLRLDPKNPTIVYAATSAGILYSTDMAGTFQPLTTGLEDAGVLKVTGLEFAGGDLYAFAGADAGLLKLGVLEGRQTLSSINFESNSAKILPSLYADLDKVLDLVRKNPTLLVRVDGHTDSRGAEEHNLDLSLRRASSVCDYLSKKGVNTNRLVPNGFGSHHPVADNETPDGQQQNRRVEVYIVGGKGEH